MPTCVPVARRPESDSSRCANSTRHASMPSHIASRRCTRRTISPRVMTPLGIALLLTGAALLVAEAHLPAAGVLGAFGVAALGAGGWLALSGAGAAAGLAVAVAVAVVLVAGGFLVIARAKVAPARRIRIRRGPEGAVCPPRAPRTRRRL